jgi:hypothetical protein
MKLMSSEFWGVFVGIIMCTPRLIVEVRDNPDAVRGREVGEDFLFWPVLVELDAEGPSEEEGIVTGASKALEVLWCSEVPAVADCDYEDRFPWRDGIGRDFSAFRSGD